MSVDSAADYNLLYSTLCLTNIVFIGLYLATLTSGRASTRKVSFYLALSTALFLLGCLLPLIEIVVGSEKSKAAALAPALTSTVAYFGTALIGIFYDQGDTPRSPKRRELDPDIQWIKHPQVPSPRRQVLPPRVERQAPKWLKRIGMD